MCTTRSAPTRTFGSTACSSSSTTSTVACTITCIPEAPRPRSPATRATRSRSTGPASAFRRSSCHPLSRTESTPRRTIMPRSSGPCGSTSAPTRPRSASASRIRLPSAPLPPEPSSWSAAADHPARARVRDPPGRRCRVPRAQRPPAEPSAPRRRRRRAALPGRARAPSRGAADATRGSRRCPTRRRRRPTAPPRGRPGRDAPPLDRERGRWPAVRDRGHASARAPLAVAWSTSERDSRGPAAACPGGGRVAPFGMRISPLALSATVALGLGASRAAQAQASASSFTIPQVLGFPFPTDLVAAPTGARIAWVTDVRDVWGADGPGFAAHPLTNYSADDGQELTNLAFTRDGQTVVYVRGGDHDANWPAEGGLAPDPAGSATQPKVQIWAVPFVGGAPRLLADGDEPAVSPRGDVVAFIRDHKVWSVPLDGSKPAAMRVFDRGEASELTWSPSGDALAFVSDRGDHSFIGLFTADSAPVRYLAPSTTRDEGPVWSPDGRRLAFVRRPGAGGAPRTLLDRHPDPWAIWVADAATGDGHVVWTSPETLRGSVSRVGDGPHLAWLTGDRILYRGELDGWPHLYTVRLTGGEPTRLTSGSFMVEDIAQDSAGSFVVYSANTGRDPSDDDRRHLFRAGADQTAPVPLTMGDGIETQPVVTGDGRTVAFIAAGPRTPPLVSVVPASGGAPRSLTPNLIPADFPTAQLVVPRRVVFRSEDGLPVHGQLFERPGGGKKPALIFVHGGPPRQMLLGWHYMDYYSGSYAMNQYYANHGYVVLS